MKKSNFHAQRTKKHRESTRLGHITDSLPKKHSIETFKFDNNIMAKFPSTLPRNLSIGIGSSRTVCRNRPTLPIFRACASFYCIQVSKTRARSFTARANVNFNIDAHQNAAVADTTASLPLKQTVHRRKQCTIGLFT